MNNNIKDTEKNYSENYREKEIIHFEINIAVYVLNFIGIWDVSGRFVVVLTCFLFVFVLSWIYKINELKKTVEVICF